MADFYVICLGVSRGSARFHHSLLPEKEIKEVLMQARGESQISLIHISVQYSVRSTSENTYAGGGKSGEADSIRLSSVAIFGYSRSFARMAGSVT